MTTTAAGERVLCMAVHVVTSRRANLKSSSVNEVLFFYSALRKNAEIWLELHILLYIQCFLRASVGFETTTE